MKITGRLTTQQLSEMRRLYVDGMPITKLAEKFNVSRVTVNNHSNSKIGGKNGKTWKELKEAREKKDADEFEKHTMAVDYIEESKEEPTPENSRLSKNDRERISKLKKTIRELDKKMKLPKIKPSEYIALSKYRKDLQDEMYGKDKVYIIPPPRHPADEEFEDDEQ